MGEKQLIPKKRFGRFKEGWEARKFETLVTRLSYTTKNKDLPQIEFEDIVSGTGRLNKDITEKKIDKKGVLFSRGDILFGKLRPYLKNWLLANFEGLAIGDFWVLRPTEYNSKFIYYLIQTNEHQKVSNLSIGTRMPRADWDTVSNTVFSVPVIQEQQKIGAFFKVLDERIANQERKIAKVKDLKSAYLTEMFPQEGETVPKKRFKGFEGEWERKVFNTLLDESDSIRRGPFGSALKKDLFVKNSDYVIYEQQNAIHDHYKYRYYISKEKYEELIRFSLNEDDFIMSGAGTIGAISKVPKGIQPGVINQALIRIKINSKVTDPEYFLQWIRSESMQKRLKEANPASAMENLIPMSELKEWDIKVPSLKEQQKIGEFFKDLDNQIEMEEKKLDKLQKMKEAYLEEMFV